MNRWGDDADLDPKVLVLIACTACGDRPPSTAVIEHRVKGLQLNYVQRGRGVGTRGTTSVPLPYRYDEPDCWCEVHGPLAQVSTEKLLRLARLGCKRRKVIALDPAGEVETTGTDRNLWGPGLGRLRYFRQSPP